MSGPQQPRGPHIDRLERLLDPILCGHSRPVRRGLSGLITLALTCSIVVRSADPIKELFSASPWLHYYDDYFIINSQGVRSNHRKPYAASTIESSEEVMSDGHQVVSTEDS